MNKNLLIAFIVLLIAGGGFLIFQNKDSSKQGHNMEGMTGNPIDQSHRSYEMEMTAKSNPKDIKLNEPTTIKYRIENDKGETLKNYAIVHEKNMHFILARKDLENFQHLHPSFDEQSGEFSIDAVFTAVGPYRLFADFTPDTSADNPQLLPVTTFQDIEVGNVSNFQPRPVNVDTSSIKTLPEGYEVSYSVLREPKAESDLPYSLTISKDGQPVTDLENYLGALGHSVILKEGSLDFIHTHPKDTKDSNGSMQGMDHGAMGHEMDSTAEKSGPKIDFSTYIPEAGVYKIFTQFQHAGSVITTDYVVKVN